MIIEKSTENDHLILTEITKKSKAYWGYSEEQLLKWNSNLTITTAYINENSVYKLVNKNKIIGYYSYLEKENKTIYLDNLFILPEKIGFGLGTFLINDLIAKVKNKGVQSIVLHSDPNAEKFYLKMGFKKIGEFETAIKNRFLPIMELKFLDSLLF